MSAHKEAAIDICHKLARKGKMSYTECSQVMKGICEFDTLDERDAELEALWDKLTDVAMNPDTEKLEEPFMHFPVGTDREDIWHWFDERHSKGVSYLLYDLDGIDRTMETANLLHCKQLCTECDSETCLFNPHGTCKVPFLTGKAPNINADGCADFCPKETTGWEKVRKYAELQSEYDEEEIREWFAYMEDDDIEEDYRVTRSELDALVPKIARVMRHCIDNSDDWTYHRDYAIEAVIADFRKEKEAKANDQK